MKRAHRLEQAVVAADVITKAPSVRNINQANTSSGREHCMTCFIGTELGKDGAIMRGDGRWERLDYSESFVS